jgi:small subunit ribosomal protein S5
MVELLPWPKGQEKVDWSFKMPQEKQWTVGVPEKEEERQGPEERIIEVGRISRTVAGGKRMRFRALVVVGDRSGHVGMGLAKAQEVAGAIAKATAKAKKTTIEIPLVSGTIPFEVEASYGSAHILLKPAPAGTSIIAGGAVRIILELAGVENAVGKMLGAPNRITNTRATFLALENLRYKWQQLSRRQGIRKSARR